MSAEPITQVLLNMAVISGAYLALFGLAEVIRQRLGMGGETTRPLVHVVSGLLALSLPVLFGEPWPVVVLGLGFLGLMVGTKLLGQLRSIHDVGRSTAGAFVYPLGIVVAFVGSDGAWPAYPVAVLTLAFADAAGGVVGRRLGGHPFRVIGGVRTVEGSVTAFVVASVATAAVLLSRDTALLSAAWVAILVGLVVVGVEAASPRGTDNLTIPAAVVALFAFALPGWPGT